MPARASRGACGIGGLQPVAAVRARPSSRRRRPRSARGAADARPVASQPVRPAIRARSASSWVTKPSATSASCISSALRACGQASSRTPAMASGSSAPRSSALRDRLSAGHHGLRAALLQRRVVEEGVRARVEDFGRERRGRRQVARDDLRPRPLPCGAAAPASLRCPSPRAGSRRASGRPAGGRAARVRRRGFPGTPTWSGKTEASRSSLFMRCSCGATLRRRRSAAGPARWWRSSASAR